MNDEEKVEIMREIVNLLAEKKCTIADTEDILHGVHTSVRYNTSVQKIN